MHVLQFDLQSRGPCYAFTTADLVQAHPTTAAIPQLNAAYLQLFSPAFPSCTGGGLHAPMPKSMHRCDGLRGGYWLNEGC